LKKRKKLQYQSKSFYNTLIISFNSDNNETDEQADSTATLNQNRTEYKEIGQLNKTFLRFDFQPLRLIGWLFNTLISQLAWTIIRLELHHLWNPDWTYAMPQGPMEGQQPPLYGEPPVGGEEGDPKEGGEGEPGEYPEYEDDDKLIDTFSVKDGGPIPLLQVTMTCI
jgi:hypothetical protein